MCLHTLRARALSLSDRINIGVTIAVCVIVTTPADAAGTNMPGSNLSTRF